MSDKFEAAAGTIVGTAHLHAGRNGQDGFAIHRRGDVTVAVVTDGCGSSPHSEVGAKIGAAIVARCVACSGGLPAADGGLKPAATQIIEQLRIIAGALEPFWTDELVFRNPDAVRRKLFVLTRKREAVLDDDTTIVVLRRRDAA